jgi:plastocyanin
MHRSTPRAALLATLLTLTFVLAACGSTSTTPAPTTAPAASTPASSAPSPEASAAGGGGGNAVTVQNFAFAPATLEVAVGTTVTWTNQDSTGHTVTADDGSFDSKTIASGQTFSQAFPTAGTFAYHCSIHSTMTATITVK